MRFELGENWGTKASNANHPQSKDAIAYRLNDQGHMNIWDWQNGTTRKPQVTANEPADYINVTNQMFIKVLAINHLNYNQIPTPNPEPNPIPNPTPDINQRLESIAKKLDELYMTLQDIEEKLNNPVSYQGKFLGFSSTFTPIKE